MNIVEKIKEKPLWSSIVSIFDKSKKRVKRRSRLYQTKHFYGDSKNIEEIKVSDLEPNICEEEFDEDYELLDIREPLTVEDYKLIYYYRTTTLIIILLVMFFTFVIYMIKNDILLVDLIPERIQAIYTSRYFHKIVTLIQGMK